jgi:hypothetical protein
VPLAIDPNQRPGRLAEFPASADEQRNQFVSVGVDEFAESNPLEFPASLPRVASAPTAAPDALLATSRPEDALENAQRDMEQALATF